MSKMQHIDPASLNHLPSRIAYDRAFVGFTEADAAALHAAKPFIAPLVPTIVDIVYVKLLSFDITAQSFIPKQTGYEGIVPTDVTELSATHPQILYRKGFLTGYLVKLVTADYNDEKTWEYFDKVGIMHTGVAGFAHRQKKAPLRVEYQHMALLLGYVVDIVLSVVVESPDLDGPTKAAVLRALNKVVWIQNDLFSRHYIDKVEAKDESGLHRITLDWRALLAIPVVAGLIYAARLSTCP